MPTIEMKLEELGIQLPKPLGPSPLADHVMVKRVGDLLFLSGVGPIKNGMPSITGRLVKDMKHEAGYEAAREAALNVLSIIKDEIGDLDKVDEFVKMVPFSAEAGNHPKHGVDARH